MNPNELFCLNPACPAKGQQGQGNIHVHSQQEERCICTVCNMTFAANKGTIFYRAQRAPGTDAAVVILVLTLLAYGCPTQAAALAFELDERTIKSWWQRAGAQCEAFHQQMVTSKQLDLQQVQARPEGTRIKVKRQGGWCWMALAMMVPTRLWLGGVVAEKRDRNLIQRLVAPIKAMARCRPLLLAAGALWAGFAAYVGAFQDAFRASLPRFGQPGGGPLGARLVAWPDIAIVQVIKRHCSAGLRGPIGRERRIVQGTASGVDRLLRTTQGALGVINSAYIERFNATMRQPLHWSGAHWARRSRSLAQQTQTLHAGMFIVGCLYNFCDYHDSLRLKLAVGEHGFRWVQRTPALAAQLTDHRWSPTELFSFRVPPERWSPPKQRGRPLKELILLMQRWC